MSSDYKMLTNFLVQLGTETIGHSDKTYLAHLIGVYKDLQSWGAPEDVCRAGMFHSIYGTEIFQKFALPPERRDEVRTLIGERAERLAHINCVMDRSTFDRALEQTEGPYHVRERQTGRDFALNAADFDDLCRVHLCDWLEQVPRSQKWDYRREAYRQMARRLGGLALESFQRVYAQETVTSRV